MFLQVTSRDSGGYGKCSLKQTCANNKKNEARAERHRHNDGACAGEGFSETSDIGDHSLTIGILDVNNNCISQYAITYIDRYNCVCTKIQRLPKW